MTSIKSCKIDFIQRSINTHTIKVSIHTTTPTNAKYIEKKEEEQTSHGSSTPIEVDSTPDRQDASSMCCF